VNSQYQGFQKPFQPTGTVNSVYGQASNNFSNTGSQNFHTSNYRGDQPGHDNYLRSDSAQTSQSGYGSSVSQQARYTPVNTSFTSGYGSNGYNQNQTQFASPNSFHTANYRGDQAGHDNYLRSDSQQPGQSSYQSGASNGNMGVSNYSNMNTNTGPQNFGTSGYGMNNATGMSQSNQQTQFVSPNSFHTANYRGDQAGHDNYLRSDSQQTVQSQYGSGKNNSSYNNNFNANKF
jgi:hypothetical protein